MGVRKREFELMTHEEKINSFIPEALRIAQKRVNKLGVKDELRPSSHKNCDYYRHSFFVQFYAQEMNRLTAKAGLRII